MDIYAYIMADHRKVASLIDELLGINLQAVQQRLFEDIKAELTLHAQAEERTFYRAIVEAARATSTERDIRHAVHDHNEIRQLVQRLTDEAITSPKWMVTFGELKHAIEHHVQEEESDVFAEARTLLAPVTAVALAEEMDRLKQTLKAEMPVQAAD